MSAAQKALAPLGRDELVQYFERALRPGGRSIGTEQEKFGLVFDGDRLVPLNYQDHIAPIFRGLIDRFGWEIGEDRGTNGEVVMLSREGASITLEPGGQLELSGAPLPTVHHTCAEFTQHYNELHAVSEPLGIAFIASGFHPFATRDEINWMPKGRYEVMREYLPTKGDRAIDMMSRTCTVQANFDYSDEEECGRRLRTALAISPILTACFANSPVLEGKINGFASNRSDVWESVDPDRCGIPRFVFDEPFSFERYIDYALDTPMFFIKRKVDGKYGYVAHHETFRHFMEHGLEHAGARHEAQWADWELHLSTLFPEVRIKPFIEIRGMDSVASRFVCSLPAMVKGLLYDDAACAEAFEIIGNLDYEARLDLWRRARKDALRDDEVHDKASRLLALSRASLEARPELDQTGRTEARFLNNIQESLELRQTPGEIALAQAKAEFHGELDGRSDEGRIALVRAFHFAGMRP